MNNPEPAPRTPQLSRRTLTGAAWATPVVIASIATPAYASSRPLATTLTITSNKPSLGAGDTATVQVTLLQDGRPWAGQLITLTLSAPNGTTLTTTIGTTNAAGTITTTLTTNLSAQAGTAYIEARTSDGTTANTTIHITALRTAREALVSVSNATNWMFYSVASSSLIRTIKTPVGYRQFTYNEDGTEIFTTNSGTGAPTTLCVLDGDTLEVKRTVPLPMNISAVSFAWSFTRDGRILAAGNGSYGPGPWGYYLIDPTTGRMEPAGFSTVDYGVIAACEVSAGRYLVMNQATATTRDTSVLAFYGAGGGIPSPDRRIAIIGGPSLQRCGNTTYLINNGSINRVDVSGNSVTFAQVTTTPGAGNYWGPGAIR